MTREEAQQNRFFIDANILLNVAEPDTGYMQLSSIAFLEKHRESLVISPLVTVEVHRQLTAYPHKYRGKKKVMRYLLVCHEVDFVSRQGLIEELGLAYAENNWQGEPGDSDDRLHAATASAFQVPFLVTWDRRFLRQGAWISQVNWRYKLAALTLGRPDTL